jgi:hypothetical protein
VNVITVQLNAGTVDALYSAIKLYIESPTCTFNDALYLVPMWHEIVLKRKINGEKNNG